MKQRVAALGLMLALAGAGAAAQDKMPLREAVDLILKNNQQVRIAAENAAGAELKIGESKSLYLPQVSIAGSCARMSLFSELSISFLGQTYTFQFGLPNNYDMRATVMEQVFNWGRTARMVEMSKSGLDLANDGVALTKHMLSYEIVPLFYGTLFFQEAIKVLDDTLKSFEKKLETAKQRYDAGLASSFDVDLLQVQISSVQAQRLDFLNNIDKFRIAFNTLSGRDPAAAFDPDGAFVFEPAVFSAGALFTEALENRVEFQQWKHSVDLGRASVALAKTGDKPTLAAGFDYEFRNGYMPDMTMIRGNWTASLSLSYPIFDGFRVRAQVAEAQSGLRAVELRKADLERSVTQEIQTALADLKVTEQKVEIEKVKIRQAEDSLRIAEERYRNGLLSATELIDAQNTVENTRLDALQLVYNHTLSKFTLYRSCGRKI
ncbi:MAG: TolC family protein [Candidatus Aminicenantales bacterium]|jgi:outer membrane protein TolC